MLYETFVFASHSGTSRRHEATTTSSTWIYTFKSVERVSYISTYIRKRFELITKYMCVRYFTLKPLFRLGRDSSASCLQTKKHHEDSPRTCRWSGLVWQVNRGLGVADEELEHSTVFTMGSYGRVVSMDKTPLRFFSLLLQRTHTIIIMAETLGKKGEREKGNWCIKSVWNTNNTLKTSFVQVTKRLDAEFRFG